MCDITDKNALFVHYNAHLAKLGSKTQPNSEVKQHEIFGKIHAKNN
jgi:hypothetical protein